MRERLGVVLVLAGGRRVRLAPRADSAVSVTEGGLAGVRGQLSREDTTRLHGGVLPGARRVGPIEAEMSLQLVGDPQLVATSFDGLRAGLPVWGSASGFGLEVTVNGGLAHTYECWLSQPLAPPDFTPGCSSVARLQVPVFIPDGVAWSVWAGGTGRVVVTNSGDVVCFPLLVWSGSPGRVVGPSGAGFVLPAAGQPRREVSLDPLRLNVPGVLPEGVPPGKEGVWVLPAGVSLKWRRGVLDPFVAR